MVMPDSRGSDLLLERWQKGGVLINEDLLQKLKTATSGLVLDDVWVKGQPKPDFLRASFTADDDESCGTGVKDILKLINKLGLGRSGRVIVFPKGIPVDRFKIELEIGGRY